MKAVILAGGRGTRLSEETTSRPKPLVEASGYPLLWHIMKNYESYGIREFIVLVGYKGQQIREYFANYWLHHSDVTFDLKSPDYVIHENRSFPWKVTVLDTGLETNTGARLKKISNHLKDDFLLTYGDGVADVDIGKLLAEHARSKNLVTLTAMQPPARFGALTLENNQVKEFTEKPENEGAWVNGGFFAVKPDIFDYIGEENESFEIEVLPRIAKQRLLGVHKHYGFWQPVDTIRDLYRLEEAIAKGRLPWI